MERWQRKPSCNADPRAHATPRVHPGVPAQLTGAYLAELHEKADQMMHVLQSMAELQHAKAMQCLETHDLPARGLNHAARTTNSQTDSWIAAEATPA